MASDFTTSKDTVGGILPTGMVDTAWVEASPLLTPEYLKRHHLFGIPLVSHFKDPITGRKQVMGDDLIKEHIFRAVTLAEADLHLSIMPRQYTRKHAFDRQHFNSFGFFKLEHRPVASIQALAVVPPNGTSVYEIPLDWIETANLAKGQINLIPINIAFVGAGGVSSSSGSAGAVFLSILGQQGWVPAYWAITYVAGFPDGMLPNLVNEYVGLVAAAEILEELASTYAGSNSHSLGVDGLSQSVSTPGPEIFTTRLTLIQQKRQVLIGKLKKQFGQKIFSGSV